MGNTHELMSSHTNENKYGEPWVASISSRNDIFNTWEIYIHDEDGVQVADCYSLGTTEKTSYIVEEDEARAKRIVKLINLFAGVPDEAINNLIESKSNTVTLIKAVLCNRGEPVPLAMLIDELQNSSEYNDSLRDFATREQILIKIGQLFNNPNVGALCAGYSSKKGREKVAETHNFFKPLLASMDPKLFVDIRDTHE